MVDRETLEQEALAVVCACYYYDLADNIDSVSDEILTEIISSDYTCLHNYDPLMERCIL